MAFDYEDLNDAILRCRSCPRLVAWREEVASAPPKRHAGEVYHAKAVPNFGDPSAKALIIGLAPAANGANRTGRMFTGDRSGEWLYRSLHRAGLANQPHSPDPEDGLELYGIVITSVCHCAPPDNKPTPEEIKNCSTFLEEIWNSRQWNAVLCLGGLAYQAFLKVAHEKASSPFSHGIEAKLASGTTLLTCYHPSQQNTFTGRLTEQMLDQVTFTLKGYCR